MRWSENSNAANPSRNLASQFTLQIFGPLALTCGFSFIVQAQPLQICTLRSFSLLVVHIYPT